MAERLARLRESTQAHDDFVDIRRGFHTLKGSGRMVGLIDLAEVAWEAEQTLNLWLRDERAINVAILDFVDQAATGFRRWVGELAETGAIGRLDADAVVALARRLRGEEVEAPTAPAAPPAMPEAPVAAPAAVAPPEPEIVQIGRHSLSAALFAIFSDEATRRLADLRQHLADLAVVADEHVWAEFARAAHTLAGIARTTGLTPLAEAAYALETWIGAWPDKQRPLAAEPEGVLSGVVDLLGNGLEQIARHEWPSFPDDLAERLTGLSPAPAESATGAAEEELFAALLAEPELPEAGSEPTPEPVPEPVPEPLVAPDWPAEAPLEIPFQPALEPVSEPPFEPLPEAVPPAPEPPVPEPWVPVPTPEFPVEPVPVEFLPETVPEFQPEGMPASFAPVAELAPPVAPEVPVEPAPAIAAEPPEECDPQLLPIFLAEAEELLPRIGDSLRRWRAAPTDAEPCQALQRTLHTLKGSARMAGAMRLGDATHAMETRIVDLGTLAPEAAFLDSLEHDYDALAERVDRLRQPAPVAAVAPAVGVAAPEAAPVAVPLAPTAEDDNALRQAFRANANILDALINEAGEVSIARSRIEDLVTHYKLTAQELTANVERLRGQLRELEIEAETQIGARMSKLDESHFDPLEFDRYTRLQELTRLMAESVNDVSTAQENLLGSLNDVEYALLQQSRTTRSLQQELMHIRMVRLNSQAERLHRIVRQAAKEVGRRAHLLIEGGDIELDRSVLDKAMAPFEHLLRNAVAHGIEAAERRQALGKPEYGDIRLTARQDGTEVVLTLSDDGGGIDLDKVRARAEAMGWVTPDDSVERERLESFLFMPGFSTMETVTQVAGRGVGLDVVRSEIASVGGRIRLDSEVGRGTRFTIRLPTTLALTQVVLARAGDQVYAFPAGMVVLVREVREADWHAIVSASGVELDGQNYPLRSLAELTGQQPQPAEGHYRTVLLLRSGDERVAMRVDKLQGNVEAVVKAIGPQLSRVPGVAGATVLPDGRVALILNPFALMESAPGQALSVVEGVRTEAVQPLVLVVDDSLTVRKITGRLLHREGYRVATAKDGVEALEYLQGEVPAVMLLDIEMPRMDGFEVARHVRADVRTRGVPIVMITSRTADKHRDHALDLGVNLYMGKPYQEEELLAAIAGFVAGQG
ncbi:response regulator [Parasulfuritortus cantonensis]|uniref:Chemotaxis protein CheA n=1 Tax=Parasulfuritortus cantonensis TaxID=2528202 RepID=A0A4R1BIT8_9PROT|nr:Hpt domain-containing protein [Parasulfuritortus cantonensis]TCJ17213.1 response regulator [Parasulfuritortus cantonensis]